MILGEKGIKFRPESLKNLMDLLFVIIEKIGCKFKIISTNYIKIYYELVKKEIKLANIYSKDLVLVIGCGSIPSTPIVLAKETNTQIVALDNDPKAVINAAQYVKNRNFQDKIKIQYGNGINYPVKDFNVIFILYGVKHQSQLLRYVSKNINENIRVIYRAPHYTQSKTQGDESRLSKLFKVKNVVNTKSFVAMDSYLLLKKIAD